MFGFINYRKETRGLGGDVIRTRQKWNKIIMGILGLIGFGLLNLILYMLTKV